MSPLSAQKQQMLLHGQPNGYFEDSINYLYWDAHKNAPVMHWAHANGFSGGTMRCCFQDLLILLTFMPGTRAAMGRPNYLLIRKT